MKIKSYFQIRFLKLCLVLVLILFAFSMCKKDLGNYEYIEIPDLIIDTVGEPRRFIVKQYKEDLVINPKIVYTGNSHLDYYWIMGPMPNDTISRERDLNVKIERPISSYSYPLYFQVVEQETGNMDVVEYRVTVTGSYGTGLLIAHELNGSSDIDLIETPTSATSVVSRNIHQTVNGVRLQGCVTGLSSVGRNSLVMFMTDQEASMMNFASMKKMFDYRESFGALNPGILKPEALGAYSDRANFLINNGKLYNNYTNSLNAGVMMQKLTMDDGSDYSLAPVYVRPYSTAGIFFDEMNKRFVQVMYPWDNTIVIPEKANEGARFSLDYIDRKYLFGDRGFQLASGVHTTLYAFFAEYSGPGRYLYVADIDNPASPDFALVDISTETDIQNAQYYAVFVPSPCVYYATEDKVYLLQVNPGGNSVVNAGVQFTAPAGEVISCIQFINATWFYVGTWNPGTGEGKVYQFSPSSGTGILGAPLKSWSDFGGKVTMVRVKWKMYPDY